MRQTRGVTEQRVSMWSIPQIRSTSLMVFAGLLSFAVMLSALPVWAVHNGIDRGLAGTVMTVLLVTTVVTQLISAPLMRKFTLRSYMILGVALLGLPSIAYPWAVELWSLYIVSGLRGIGFGFLTVTAAVAVQRAAPVGRQGEAIGFYGLAGGLPMAVGAGIGAGLTLSGHFPIVVILAALPILGVLAAPGIEAHPVPQAEHDGLPLPTALRRLITPVITLFVATAAGGAVVTLVPLEITLSSHATIILIVFGAVGAVFRWRIGIYTDQHGHRGVPETLMVVGAIGMAVMAVGFTTLSTVVLIAGVIGVAIAYGALQSVSLDAAFARLPASQATVASATWNAFFDAGTGAGTAIFAALAATSLHASGAMVAGGVAFVLIAGLSLIGTLRRR